MKILIIDDEKNVSDFFLHVAETRGHEDVDTVASGEDALTHVMRKTYDLITVDIRMPGVSGLEIIAMLRNMSPHAIIAIMSGFIPDEIPDEVAACVDVLIPKPVSVDTFSRLLEGVEEIGVTMEKIQTLGRAPIPSQ